MSGEGDPRFDVRPPLRRPAYALTGLHAPRTPSVIIPPPMRRETAERPRWQPGDVVLPALDDDGDLPTLASQMDHEPEGAK